MDLNLIKKILKREGGKIIIVEDGNPVMVISSFEEYAQKMEAPASMQPMARPRNEGIAMPAARPIQPMQPPVMKREEKPFVPSQQNGEESLTIDDLPF